MNRYRIVVPALLALALYSLIGARADAQTPPTRFFGFLTIDGSAAPAGTRLTASINGVECGAVTTTEEGRYVLDVQAWATIEGCGIDEAVIAFFADGYQAMQYAPFQQGHFVNLDLSVDTTMPPPPPPTLGEPPAVDPPPAEDLPTEVPPADPPPDELPAE